MSAKAFFWAVTTFIHSFVRTLICLSVRSSGQILLPQYLMKGLSSVDETYKEYSLAPTDDLIKL